MTQKFDVVRQHLGDRMYMPGDTREASPDDVAHLIAKGVLKPIKGKAEVAPRNKAEPKLQDKAD